MPRISRFLDVIIAVVHLLQRPKGCKELGVNIFECTVGKIYFLSYCCEILGPDFSVCLVGFFQLLIQR